jgi:hypothetical protein
MRKFRYPAVPVYCCSDFRELFVGTACAVMTMGLYGSFVTTEHPVPPGMYHCPLNVDIAGCLDDVFKAEPVSEYQCESCKARHPATITKGYTATPDVLLLQIVCAASIGL